MSKDSPLTQAQLDAYYFEMFSKGGEKACKVVVKTAWKRLSSSTRITAEQMDKYLESLMNKKAEKYPEIWDTEPRDKIRYLVARKAKEYDYDFSDYLN